MRASTATDPRPVTIDAGRVALAGDLVLPEGAAGLVLFAHGSGSGRKSPRNRLVAGALNREGIATLLFDLLTPVEEEAERFDAHLRFDIDLLAPRLAGATDWARADARLGGLPVGYFGASTGAAAALKAAARRDDIRAVVSRGGRPDLAGDALPLVRAPTLLIVGGEDFQVIPLNESALAAMRAPERRMEIVPGATHLFEEPGTLEAAAALAAAWFRRHLVQ